MTESERPALRQALRGLLLPIDYDREEAAVDAVQRWLLEHGVSETDWSSWLRLRRADWEATPEVMPADLREVVRLVIEVAASGQGRQLADRYPKLHHELMYSDHLSFSEALGVVGHASLMASLRAEHKMSAAQIARVISAQSAQLDIHWESVQRVLDAMGQKPMPPSIEQLVRLGEQDADNSLQRFADVRIEEGPEILEFVAQYLGFGEGLGDLLHKLVPLAESPRTPYLQILEYQLSLVEYLDHPLEIAYEFSPRGRSADHVYNRWPSSLRAVGNAMLNNAKAVYALDLAWARGSDAKSRSAAYALAELFQALDAMPWLARRELAGWLRAWLSRVRVLLGRPHRTPVGLGEEAARRLLDVVRMGNTSTYGILEQRLVDAIGMFLHPRSEGWWNRGVGDSVFAPNRARRKLGDIEFQQSSSRQVIAYEAHGGRLSRIYCESHLQTMLQVLPERIRELSFIDDLDKWSLNVKYVAHAIAPDVSMSLGDPDPATEFTGLATTIEAMTFEDLLNAAGDVSAWMEEFRRHIHLPLTADTTSEGVYQKYCAALGVDQAS